MTVDKVMVVEKTVTFSQEPDSCQSGHNEQYLKITLTDAGGGPYFVLESNRWAFDSIEDLVKIFKEQFDGR